MVTVVARMLPLPYLVFWLRLLEGQQLFPHATEVALQAQAA
jgi:hypothetical protein